MYWLMIDVFGYVLYFMYGEDVLVNVSDFIVGIYFEQVVGIVVIYVYFGMFEEWVVSDDFDVCVFFVCFDVEYGLNGFYGYVQWVCFDMLVVVFNDLLVGFFVWIVEKFLEWVDMGGDDLVVVEVVILCECILIEVMIYWVMQSIVLFFCLYYEGVDILDVMFVVMVLVVVFVQWYEYDYLEVLVCGFYCDFWVFEWFEQGGYFMIVEVLEVMVECICVFVVFFV